MWLSVCAFFGFFFPFLCVCIARDEVSRLACPNIAVTVCLVPCDNVPFLFSIFSRPLALLLFPHILSYIIARSLSLFPFISVVFSLAVCTTQECGRQRPILGLEREVLAHVRPSVESFNMTVLGL